MTKSTVMTRAWEIKKTTEKSFSECLKLSWKETKIEKISNLWEKYGKKRGYFDFMDFIDLEVNRYGTGNISSAVLNGEKISNTQARKIIEKYNYTKCFYDYNTFEIIETENTGLKEIIEAAL